MKVLEKYVHSLDLNLISELDHIVFSTMRSSARTFREEYRVRRRILKTEQRSKFWKLLNETLSIDSVRSIDSVASIDSASSVCGSLEYDKGVVDPLKSELSHLEETYEKSKSDSDSSLKSNMDTVIVLGLIGVLLLLWLCETLK
jgi:hypothetical protein